MAVAAVGGVETKIDLSGATHTTDAYSLDGAANLVVVRVGWVELTTITGVTWGGAACTSAGTQAEDSNGHKCQIWYRVSPTTGSATAAVTFSGSTAGSEIGVTGYSGVDTGTPVAGYAIAEAAGISGAASPATCTTSASAVAGDLAISTYYSDGAPTVSGGGTQEYNIQGTLFEANYGAGSYEAGTGAIALAWTYTGTVEWAMTVLILKADEGEAETITMDKWLGRQEARYRPKWQAVPSGTVGIKG